MMSKIGSDVYIALLGPLQVWIDGEERPITGPIQRALLAVLAQHPGEVLSLDLLCELVWDGTPPATAESALRVHVSHLRKRLGRSDLLERIGAGYRLAITRDQVDFAGFDHHTRSGREALHAGDLEQAGHDLRAAKGLWRGLPLADVRSGATAEIERLLTQRSELNVDLAELQMRTQGANTDTGDLSALTVERPFDERVWSLLITAQYWNGRQGDALQTYHRAVAALDEELGVQPTAALRRLQEQILRHDPALDPPAAANVDLPVFATSFVGRSAEIEALTALIGRHRLATLTGLGGVGKTRLSVAAAEAAAAHFNHGVVFASFEALEDPALVPSVVAAALGTSAADVEGVAAALDTREQLLVLDNCEHVAEAVADLVSGLLAACPRVRVLATSRVPLNVVGESVWVTPMLEVSGDGASAPEAVRLFLERARQAGPSTVLPEDDDPRLREVASLLGGLPLAIELAAAQCGVLTVPDVIDQLHRNLGSAASERDRPTRHQSMEVALTGTLEHLRPAARELLSRMRVFRSPVGVEAIEAVCSDSAVPGGDLPALLAELTHAAVVVADLSGERGRYSLLPPVRRSAPQVLSHLGHPPPELRTRHLEYLHHQVREAVTHVGGPGEAPALAGLGELDADLRAGLAHAVETDPQRGLSVAAALSPFWMRRRMHTEGRRWLRQLLEASDGADPAVRGAALHAAGGLAWDDGDRPAGEKLLHQAWQIRKGLGDKAGQALTLNNMAGLASDRGDHAAAYEMWSRAHGLFMDSAHAVGAAATELNRGIAAHKLGRLDDAATHLESARTAYRDLGSTHMEAMALERLAGIEAERGQHPAAMILTRSAQAIYADVGSPEQQARLGWQRALRHRALGEETEARELVRTVAQAVIADELLDAWWVAGLIETSAALEAPEGPEHAAGLLGVARRHRERSGHGADPTTVPDLPDVLTRLGEVLGPERLTEEMAVSGARSVAVVVAGIAGLGRQPDLPVSARTAARPAPRPS